MKPFIITFELPKIPTNEKLCAIAEQSARNLISLFADHEAEIQQAITESEDVKTTFNHAIVLDLGKNKQTDKLGFSIKRGDEITMSIPNPEQPNLFDFEHPRDLRKGAKTVEAEEVPLAIEAPVEVLGLGLRERTDEENEAFESGKQAFAADIPFDQNPFDSEDPEVEDCHIAWAQGWRHQPSDPVEEETESTTVTTDEETF